MSLQVTSAWGAGDRLSLFGQYKRLKNEFTAVLTGKSICYGGSLIRPEATATGRSTSPLDAQDRGDDLEGKVCTVSGSGNVAQYTVEKLLQLGAKVVSLSDSGGTVYDKEGINEEKLAWLMELKNVHRGRIRDYAEKFGAEYLEGKRPWHIPCDCAFPSATQNELTGKDVETLIRNGCFVVSEGANMPTTPEGVDRFIEKGILYGPGKAANAGGVAVSGLEMSQNSMRLCWPREEVDQRLQEIMRSIHSNCYETAREYGYPGNYVIGANIAGFVKVAEAMLYQGLV